MVERDDPAGAPHPEATQSARAVDDETKVIVRGIDAARDEPAEDDDAADDDAATASPQDA